MLLRSMSNLFATGLDTNQPEVMAECNVEQKQLELIVGC